MVSRNWSEDIVALGDRIVALTVRQATALNHYLAEVHGIEPVASHSPAPQPDVVVNNTEAEPVLWDVVLEGIDPRYRIPVMRMLREKCGLTLLQARNVVESTPQRVGENLPFADAEALRTALEAAGAKVTLRKVA